MKVCPSYLFIGLCPSSGNKMYLFYYLFLTCCLLFQLGYTFVAVAITPESIPVGAKWKMRLIGSREPLPKLSHEMPLNAFSVKEFRDYYVPNNKNLICR